MTDDELMKRIERNEIESLMSLVNEDFDLTIYNDNSYEILSLPLKIVGKGGLQEAAEHIESRLRFKGVFGNFVSDIKEILQKKAVYK